MERNRWKRICAGALAAALAMLSGCGEKGQEAKPEMTATTMGRYLEEELDGMKAVYQILPNPDGSMDFYQVDQNNDYAMSASNYKEGKLTPIDWEWLDQIDQFGEVNVEALTRDQSGQVYVLGQDYTNYDSEGDTLPPVRLFRMTEAQELEEVPLLWEPISMSSDKKVFITEGGDAVISAGYGGVYQYDLKTGKKKFEYTGEYWADAAVQGNELYLSMEDEGKIYQYSLETGMQEKEITPEGVGHESARLAVDASGTLFACDYSGLSKWDQAAGKWEQVIDGELNLMSMKSMNKRFFTANPDGSFFVVYGRSNLENVVARYAYDENVPSRPLETLSVCSLWDNPTLRDAIRQMRSSNPDVFVKYRVMIEGENGIPVSDALKSINTELLSGKGADLYLLDGLPMDSYIEKGVFLDISDLVTPVVQDGGYPPILEAFQKDGKIYAVPARFAAPMMWGSSEFLDQVKSISDLAGWAEQHPDVPVLNTLGWEDLIERFYPVCGPVWASREKGIEPEGLKEFLESIKRLNETGKALEGSYNGITESGGRWREYDYIDSFSPEMLAMKEKECQMIADNVISLAFMRANQYAMKLGGITGGFTSLAGQSERTFIPLTIAGINAKSSHIELAKDMLRILLSEEVQDHEFEDGLPIRRAQLEKRLSKREDSSYAHGGFGSTSMRTGEAINMRIGEDDSWLTEPEQEQAKAYFNSLDTLAAADKTILGMIKEEAAPYFEGSRSLDETVSAISQRAQAYLNE